MKYHIGAIDSYKHREIQDILEGDFCNLESSTIYRGEALTIGWVSALIVDIFGLVAAGKKIDQEGIKILAGFIITEFHWLTIPDIKLALNRGCTGRYGEIYDRLDVPVIMGWIRCYAAERVATSEMRRRAIEQEESKEEKKPVPPEIQAKLVQLEQKMNIALATKALAQTSTCRSLDEYAELNSISVDQAKDDFDKFVNDIWELQGPIFEDLGLTINDMKKIELRNFLHGVPLKDLQET